MKKEKLAYADSIMPEVTISRANGNMTIQLFLNPRKVYQKRGEGEPVESYEFDFNEIRCPENFIKAEDVEADPAKFISFNYGEVRAMIERLKAELAKTDHIDNKLIEGVVTREQVADKIAEREELRRQIRKLLGEPAPYAV